MYNSEDDIRLIELGARIKRIRLAKGMSQYQLALNCEMEKSTVSKIESGKVNISYLVLCRLSRCLGIPIKDLAEDFKPSDAEEKGDSC